MPYVIDEAEFYVFSDEQNFRLPRRTKLQTTPPPFRRDAPAWKGLLVSSGCRPLLVLRLGLEAGWGSSVIFEKSCVGSSLDGTCCEGLWTGGGGRKSSAACQADELGGGRVNVGAEGIFGAGWK